jgi:hypothetical protein
MIIDAYEVRGGFSPHIFLLPLILYLPPVEAPKALRL